MVQYVDPVYQGLSAAGQALQGLQGYRAGQQQLERGRMELENLPAEMKAELELRQATARRVQMEALRAEREHAREEGVRSGKADAIDFLLRQDAEAESEPPGGVGPSLPMDPAWQRRGEIIRRIAQDDPDAAARTLDLFRTEEYQKALRERADRLGARMVDFKSKLAEMPALEGAADLFDQQIDTLIDALSTNPESADKITEGFLGLVEESRRITRVASGKRTAIGKIEKQRADMEARGRLTPSSDGLLANVEHDLAAATTEKDVVAAQEPLYWMQRRLLDDEWDGVRPRSLDQQFAMGGWRGEMSPQLLGYARSKAEEAARKMAKDEASAGVLPYARSGSLSESYAIRVDELTDEILERSLDDLWPIPLVAIGVPRAGARPAIDPAQDYGGAGENRLENVAPGFQPPAVKRQPRGKPMTIDAARQIAETGTAAEGEQTPEVFGESLKGRTQAEIIAAIKAQVRMHGWTKEQGMAAGRAAGLK